MKTKHAVGAAALTVLLLTAVTACAAPSDGSLPSPPSESAGQTPASGSAAPAPSPSSSSSETASLDGVTCDDLVPIAVVQANFSDVAVQVDSVGTAAETLPGPAARQAAELSTEVLSCGWAFPGGSDGGVGVYGLTADADTQSALIAELRSAGTFAESSVDDALSFTRVEDSEVAVRAVGYLFDGPVWIAFSGNSPVESFDRDYAPAMLRAIRPGAES